MKKLYKTIIFTLFAVFATSCSMNLMNQNVDNEKSAYISFANVNNARTVLPNTSGLSLEDFSDFTLSGTKNNNSSEKVSKTFATSQDLFASRVAISQGSWTFSLTAKKGSTTFLDTISKEIFEGENTLSFNLKLKSLGNASGKGSTQISISFNNSYENIAPVVKATLKKLDEINTTIEENIVVDITTNEGKNIGTYTKSDLEPASYELTINFVAQEDESQILHSRTQIIQIADGFTSVGSLEIKDLNDLIYNITYEKNDGEFTAGTTAPATYSSSEGLYSLPMLEKIGYLFDGWFTEDSFTNKVENIAQGSVGNKTFYAKFSPRTDITYKVEYYWQNLEDEEYTLYESVDKTGTLGAECQVDEKSYEHLTLVSEKNENATILADGSAVAKRFYNRNLLTVTFDTDGKIEIPPQKVKYGTKITKPAVSIIEETYTSPYITHTSKYALKMWQLDGQKFDLEQPITSDVTLKAIYARYFYITDKDSLDRDLYEWYLVDLKNQGQYYIKFSGDIEFDTLKSILGSYNSSSSSFAKKLPDGIYISIDLSELKITKYTNVFDCEVKYAGYNSWAYVINEIILPNNITTIGSDSFQGLKELETVIIPNTVTKLESRAFGRSYLKNLKIPNSVIEIEKVAFQSDNLETIDFNANIKIIPSNCFSFCKIKTINIPNSVEVIEEEAFFNLGNFEKISIPDNVKKIYPYAFMYCNNLVLESSGRWSLVNEETGEKWKGYTNIKLTMDCFKMGFTGYAWVRD